MKKLAILVSLSFSSVIAFSADLTPQKQQQYGQAYGSVQGYAVSMTYMRDNCGGIAKDARKVWDARNAVQEVQADALALPPAQKAIACSKFAAQVRAGGWDIQRKDPALFKFLEMESR